MRNVWDSISCDLARHSRASVGHSQQGIARMSTPEKVSKAIASQQFRIEKSSVVIVSWDTMTIAAAEHRIETYVFKGSELKTPMKKTRVILDYMYLYRDRHEVSKQHKEYGEMNL
jgi:hypothetical protein